MLYEITHLQQSSAPKSKFDQTYVAPNGKEMSEFWRIRPRERTSSVLILLASCQQTCMTYTIAVCRVKNS